MKYWICLTVALAFTCSVMAANGVFDAGAVASSSTVQTTIKDSRSS